MQLVMHLHGISVKGFIPGFWDAIISSSPLNIAWPANNLSSPLFARGSRTSLQAHRLLCLKKKNCIGILTNHCVK
jgi:hypothetical protein